MIFRCMNPLDQKKTGSEIGVHVSLQPVLVSEYSDVFEMIVVEIKASKEARVIVGYGPTVQRMPFFATL